MGGCRGKEKRDNSPPRPPVPGEQLVLPADWAAHRDVTTQTANPIPSRPKSPRRVLAQLPSSREGMLSPETAFPQPPARPLRWPSGTCPFAPLRGRKTGQIPHPRPGQRWPGCSRALEDQAQGPCCVWKAKGPWQKRGGGCSAKPNYLFLGFSGTLRVGENTDPDEAAGAGTQHTVCGGCGGVAECLLTPPPAHPWAPRLQPECQEEEEGGGRMRWLSSCIWRRMGRRKPQEMFSSPSTMSSPSSCARDGRSAAGPRRGWRAGPRQPEPSPGALAVSSPARAPQGPCPAGFLPPGAAAACSALRSRCCTSSSVRAAHFWGQKRERR